MFGFDRFELDGNFFTRSHVRSEINISKGTGTDLPTETVLFTHPQFHTEGYQQ
jgi:hypothetical protein